MKWLPHIVVLVWLLFLGVTIWSHAVSSQQPPIYDAISYFQKAKNFWEYIDRGQWFNPLNIQPTVRPPGTVLMSYPFGISTEFHGFHFRSVYFPILGVVFAVYLAIGFSRALTMGWGMAGIALLLSSLPLFYQFEWVDRTQSQWSWGMVDGFQAGVAALAAAASVRSLRLSSLSWLGLGTVMASFTLLIKPSGIVVMAVIAASWFVLAIRAWRAPPQDSGPSISQRGYVLYGVIIISVIYAVIVTLCVSSEYLSQANFSLARKALVIMREVLPVPFSQYPALIHRSIGEAVIIWVAAIVIFYWNSGYARRDFEKQDEMPEEIGFLVLACLVWLGGVWYWLVVQAGGDQIRYFFPFALIGIIYLVPMGIKVWQQMNFRGRATILFICTLPAVNLSCLLLQRNPPTVWQAATGVNVSVGTSRLEEDQAHAFLEKVRNGDRDVKVYVFRSGIPSVAFTSVGNHAMAVRPDLPAFHSRPSGQIYWREGFVTRIGELLSVEYILFRPVKSDAEKQALMTIRAIDTFELENHVFEAWLSGLTEKHGVRLVSETRVRLLEIIDHARFEQALDQFVTGRSWPAAFTRMNPRRYWSATEALSFIDSPIAKEIRFGALYTLHALSMRHSDEGLKVEIWWEEIKPDVNNSQRFMFLQLIDAQGKIYRNQQVGLNYNDIHPDRRWRYDSITFQFPIDSKVESLAIGISHPNRRIGMLAVDKGSNHWGGQRRVVVPLSAAR